MANGRDLKIAILSDTSGFDTSKAADDLDTLGTAAKDAGTAVDKMSTDVKANDLDALGKDAKGAGDDLDKLAKDAKDTATKVDTAFDKIAGSSKSNLAKVDDSADKASRGLKDMKAEAGQTARESAASFSDVTSALDAVQEIAANAFAGFGPAGAAAGVAAAAGIGLLFSSLQNAADKVNETKARVADLASAIVDAGGSIDGVDLAGRMKEWSLEIVNNKSMWEFWQTDAVTNIETVADKAKAAGISFEDLAQAMTGDDPTAYADMLALINDRLTANIAASKEHASAVSDEGNATDATTIALDAEKAALDAAKEALTGKSGETDRAITLAGQVVEATEKARTAQEAETAATEAQRAAMQAAADATAAFATANETAAETVATSSDDLATAIETAAERIADASPEKDTWTDWAETAIGSINDVIAAQERDLQASIDFQTNAEEVYASVGQAGVEWADAQGPNAAKAMEMLANAPKEKQKEIVDNYIRLGLLQTEGVGDGMVNGKPVVKSAAAGVHATAKAQLDKEIKIPTGVQSARGAAQLAWNDAQNWLNGHPLIATVHTAPGMLVNGRRVT